MFLHLVHECLSTVDQSFSFSSFPAVFLIMVLRKGPIQKGMFGVHWTQWFFPSLVARAVYRRFGPTPHNMDPDNAKRVTGRLAFAYMITAWTFCGFVAVWYWRSDAPPSVRDVIFFYRFFFVECSSFSMLTQQFLLMTITIYYPRSDFLLIGINSVQ
jgi:hypothetical protein